MDDVFFVVLIIAAISFLIFLGFEAYKVLYLGFENLSGNLKWVA
jgi:hypothetical protein